MIETILRRQGAFVLRQYELAHDVIILFVRTLKGFRSVFSPAGFEIILRQLYFTAVQPVPIVFAGAFVMGAVIVHYIINFFTSIGANDQIGDFILLVIVNELSSAFVAIIVMLRSGSAMISEIALMKLNNELNTLKGFSIDMYEYLMFPRFTAIVLSNIMLAVFFCLIALIGGFISFGYINNTPFKDYLMKMAASADMMDFITVYIKSTVFGLIIVFISIRDALSVKHSITEVPVKLIHGLVLQLMLIVFFDLVYDMIRYGNIL
ncbi:MAG: ABC transporter permease [Nitrospirota bacterium]|nr:MAG: ABC transporter permease [Nitrospirota bacterium]